MASEHVSAVSVKLPTFWQADPQLWFAQVDVHFQACGISAQQTKFDHVVASLSPEVAVEVRDLILNPSSEPYDELQKQLIQRTSQSERRRLQQLLSGQDLGHLTPTCMAAEKIKAVEGRHGQRHRRPSLLRAVPSTPAI